MYLEYCPTKDQLETGVYALRNLKNGKVYVGSASKSFKQRLDYHRKNLKANRHPNKHLQFAWNMYGGGFVVLVLERCIPDLCLQAEQRWIDRYSAAKRTHGYNGRERAESVRGFKFSEESKKKLSDMRRGKKLSKEHVAKLSANAKKQWAEKREKMMESLRSRGTEWKESLSKSQKGKTFTQETLSKMSRAHLGVPLSEQHKNAIGNAHRGRKMSERQKNNIAAGQRRRWKREKEKFRSCL